MSHPVRRARGLSVVLAAGVVLATAGCGGSDTPPLLLAGPTTNITVTMPAGWHQVINSSAPLIPEMVTPTTCMGSNETACAVGLIRIATTTGADAADAAHSVSKAVTGEPGVSAGPSSVDGPAPVGGRDGFRQRFTFTNARGVQDAEVAVVASGPTAPDAQGQREFSVILGWVPTHATDEPTLQTVDQVVDSVVVHGGDAHQ